MISHRISKLKTWRDAKAASLEIDASLVLTKMLIYDIAQKNPTSIQQIKTIDNLRKWRVTEFGREILELLKKL